MLVFTVSLIMILNYYSVIADKYYNDARINNKLINLIIRDEKTIVKRSPQMGPMGGMMGNGTAGFGQMMWNIIQQMMQQMGRMGNMGNVMGMGRNMG